MNNEPFPKLPERPEEERARDPIGVLTAHLCTIIDLLTGQFFVDLLPLIGGPEAKKELKRWNLGFQKGNDTEVFDDMKTMSTYSTLALAGYYGGTNIQTHIKKSAADGFKAVFETANIYHACRDHLYDFKRTLKSKDLKPIEKLEALWAVLDVLYEERKASIMENAKNDPETIKTVIDDLNRIFISLDKLTEASKMLNILIITPGAGNNNNNSPPSSSNI
jgi:hypothetical protein